MAEIKVSYDYHEGQLAPVWYIFKFKPGVIDWDKIRISFRLDAPFERMNGEDFDQSTQGVSILDSDLTVNPFKPGCFSVDLQAVRKRAETEYGIDFYEVEQLVIQVADIEEIMQMNPFR